MRVVVFSNSGSLSNSSQECSHNIHAKGRGIGEHCRSSTDTVEIHISVHYKDLFVKLAASWARRHTMNKCTAGPAALWGSSALS